MIACTSSRVDYTGTPVDYFSLGDGLIPSNQSTNILDPERVTRKGRPPCKRKQGAVKKVVKKKRATKSLVMPSINYFLGFIGSLTHPLRPGIFILWAGTASAA